MEFKSRRIWRLKSIQLTRMNVVPWGPVNPRFSTPIPALAIHRIRVYESHILLPTDNSKGYCSKFSKMPIPLQSWKNALSPNTSSDGSLETAQLMSEVKSRRQIIESTRRSSHVRWRARISRDTRNLAAKYHALWHGSWVARTEAALWVPGSSNAGSSKSSFSTALYFWLLLREPSVLSIVAKFESVKYESMGSNLTASQDTGDASSRRSN